MPMKRAEYPADWDDIANDLKTDSDWCCEGCGKQCYRPGERHEDTRKTLTTAHINHTPADCRRENLIALCSVCHLAYDAPMKQFRRIAKKRETRAQGQLKFGAVQS